MKAAIFTLASALMITFSVSVAQAGFGGSCTSQNADQGGCFKDSTSDVNVAKSITGGFGSSNVEVSKVIDFNAQGVGRDISTTHIYDSGTSVDTHINDSGFNNTSYNADGTVHGNVQGSFTSAMDGLF